MVLAMKIKKESSGLLWGVDYLILEIELKQSYFKIDGRPLVFYMFYPWVDLYYP